MDDSGQFCRKLCELTDGAITVALSPGSSTPSKSSQPQKRGCTDQGGVAKRKSGHAQEKRNRLQEEIPGHQIGKLKSI